MDIDGAIGPKVHQLLHGYKDGHQRISGSLSLDRQSERTVLTLSDMSGPNMVPGFESYLTGYPLPQANKYALARTWYAPEMPRPGSVWTHTLLLDFEDMQGVANAKPLQALLRRPSADSVSTYERPAILTPEHGEPRPATSGIEEAAALVQALYSSTRPLLIPAQSASDFEELILELWLQQWPRLRSSFRFCTGSLANRFSETGAFDLQVIPETRESQFRRSLADAMSVRPRPLVSEVAATWAQIGAADIFSIGEHRVRVFLNYFAEDVKPARPVYRELVDVYLKLSDPALDSTDLRVILEQLARQFPNPNDGRRLKNWVFGGEQRGVWNPPPPTNEAATLSVLVTSPWSESSLDRQGLRLSARAGALALKDATAAMRIAMEAVGTYSALGEDFLSGLAVALGWKSDLLAAVPTDLLEALLSRNDRLVFERVVWQRIPEAAVAAVSRVDLEEVTRDQFRTVFHGLLNRGRAHIQVASQLISRAPDTAMQGLIDELLWRQVNNWDDDWWRLVKANPAPTMSWLDNSATARPDEVLRVLIQLRPSDRAVLQHGTDTWLGVLGVTSTELASSDTQLIIYAFILAVGFLGTKGEPFELVKRTFQVIHDACLGDSLPQRAWRILEPHVSLRTTWWWWSDDRPYRLRLTLVEVFIRRHWPIRIFLETFHTNRLIVECLEDGRSVRSGQIFKRRVLEELRAGVASTDFDVDDVLSALERS